MTRDNAELCALEADATTDRRGLWALPPKQGVRSLGLEKRPKQFVDYSSTTAEQCVSATPTAEGAVPIGAWSALPFDVRYDERRGTSARL
jgi:hypothetical protein